MSIFRTIIILFLLSGSSLATAENLRVAVASNFSATLKQLAEAFEAESGHQVLISSASTGKLFSQIVHGAPYDVFLSADAERADILQQKGLAVSSQLYAKGQLVYIARGVDNNRCYRSLAENKTHRISIANPKIAPYGAAASEVLKKLGFWESYKNRLLMGENILQAYQFIATGNIAAGFIARSLVIASNELDDFCQWQVPVNLYQPINQKVAMLTKSANKKSVKNFMIFLKSKKAREIILRNGYAL